MRKRTQSQRSKATHLSGQPIADRPSAENSVPAASSPIDPVVSLPDSPVEFSGDRVENVAEGLTEIASSESVVMAVAGSVEILPDEEIQEAGEASGFVVSGVVHAVLQQSFKRVDRFRSAIVETNNPDPEDIHQMRVNLRQIRSCLGAFSAMVMLPKSAQESAVKSFAKQLGSVRDLDILQEHLQQRYLPIIPETEQPYLQKILCKLNQKRNDRLVDLIEDLKGDRYRQLKRAYRSWLRSPRYNASAHLSFSLVLPDLLLPLLSQLLQHPGWFVGTALDSQSHCVIPREDFTIMDLQAQESQVHDLRKTIKQMRYQIALLAPFAQSDRQPMLSAIVADLKHLQESLGALQDLAIIRGVLRSFLARKGVDFNALAHCLSQLDHEQWQLWQAWKPIQDRYLNPAFRGELRQQLAGLA